MQSIPAKCNTDTSEDAVFLRMEVPTAYKFSDLTNDAIHLTMVSKTILRIYLVFCMRTSLGIFFWPLFGYFWS